jgi:hypothetical protein
VLTGLEREVREGAGAVLGVDAVDGSEDRVDALRALIGWEKLTRRERVQHSGG